MYEGDCDETRSTLSSDSVFLPLNDDDRPTFITISDDDDDSKYKTFFVSVANVFSRSYCRNKWVE